MVHFGPMQGDIREQLDALSRKQLGLITRHQARAAGLSSSALERRLASGELQAVRRRVYRLRSGPADTPHQRLLAICLSLGPGTVASHRSAAWLWGLDGFRGAPRLLELTTVHGKRVRLPGTVLHQRRAAMTEGFTHVGGVPVTILSRTLLDLASFLPDPVLETALDSAARYRFGYFEELAEFLSGLNSHGRKGLGRLYALVRFRRGAEPTGSPFETKLFQRLRRAGIERPVLQHPIFKDPDRPLCHADFAWPRKKIALFADSNYHLGRRARLDATQRLELIKLGWKPIVVFPKMLDDSAWISSFAELFWPEDPFRDLGV